MRRTIYAFAKRSLVVPMLEEQPAASQKVSGRFLDDDAHRVQPVSAGLDRELRLELQVREVRIARRDIGRVADDGLETLAGDRLEPAAVPQLDVEVEARRIPLRDLQRRGARVARDDARSRQVAFQR